MLTKFGEQISRFTSLEADKDFYEIKDAIPTLSRVCSELILQLTRYGQLNSMDSTLEAMSRELKVCIWSFSSIVPYYFSKRISPSSNATCIYSSLEILAVERELNFCSE